MGCTVNMGQAVAAFTRFVASEEYKAALGKMIDEYVIGIRRGGGAISGNIHTPEQAADKFIEVLRITILSSGLSADAIESVSQWDYGRAIRVGNCRYVVHVIEDADMSRPTMSKKDDDIDDIALLLNDGVDHDMKRVYGKWHGKHTRSRIKIPKTEFMENAVLDFMGNYASEYGVENIEIIKDN